MPTADDMEFKQQVLANKLATTDQIEECLTTLHCYEAAGTIKPLSSIFLDKGYLTGKQVYAIYHFLDKAQRYLIRGYTIIETLGQGGLGTVYKARQDGNGRNVAIKIMFPHLVSNQDYVQRFMREANLSAKLDHPHIVRGLDFGETESGLFYFVMEFINGRSVKTIIQDSGAFEENKAVQVILCVAEGLKYAEQHNLIHRDIKPENIMITQDGVPKLCDLGLAKSLSSDMSVTTTGIMVGTPYYISPEQARGLKDLDIRSDIYSLGVTLFHLVTGEVPYKGETVIDVINQHLNAEIPSPRMLNPHLSEKICQIISKMMAKNREQRYSNSQSLIVDLQEFLDSGFQLDVTQSLSDISEDKTVTISKEAKSVTVRPPTTTKKTAEETKFDIKSAQASVPQNISGDLGGNTPYSLPQINSSNIPPEIPSTPIPTQSSNFPQFPQQQNFPQGAYYQQPPIPNIPQSPNIPPNAYFQQTPTPLPNMPQQIMPPNMPPYYQPTMPQQQYFPQSIPQNPNLYPVYSDTSVQKQTNTTLTNEISQKPSKTWLVMRHLFLIALLAGAIVIYKNQQICWDYIEKYLPHHQTVEAPPKPFVEEYYLGLADEKIYTLYEKRKAAIIPKVLKPNEHFENMVYIKGGSFLKGSGLGDPDEEIKSIQVKSFWMDTYEVSNSKYREFCLATKYPVPEIWKKKGWDKQIPSEFENLPVTFISFYDASCYAHWLGKRLPTEDEWEYSSRTTADFDYPWGWRYYHDIGSKIAEYANIGTQKPAFVNSYSKGKTATGIFHLCGNVWEWTSSNLGKENHEVVIKGGSFTSTVYQARASYRNGLSRNAQKSDVGFRCVLDDRSDDK